ncbi:MAG: hypothetical protein H5T91_08770 [Synergistetes bacterium]|nr:hypothetical protein [Synergistota bacterium]MDK2871136.1 hypothetical protein [bacterium]
MVEPFHFKTEFWIPIYTGIKVESLQEFIDALQIVPENSILYHLYVNLFNFHSIPFQYTNSIAYWLYNNGYETIAEKVSIIDPTEEYDLEKIRKHLIAILSEYSTKEDIKRFVSNPFYFRSVYREVLPTNMIAHNLDELIEGVKSSSIRSVFYHFITSRIDKKTLINDYSEWLINMGHGKKAESIATIDIYTLSLYDIKEKLVEVLSS